VVTVSITDSGGGGGGGGSGDAASRLFLASERAVGAVVPCDEDWDAAPVRHADTAEEADKVLLDCVLLVVRTQVGGTGRLRGRIIRKGEREKGRRAWSNNHAIVPDSVRGCAYGQAAMDTLEDSVRQRLLPDKHCRWRG
jgi:hypothetical protein